MTMRKTLMTMTALLGLTGGHALAQTLPAGEVTRSAIEQAFAAYDYIEIKYGPTQVKVEAIDNATLQKVEAVYDRATGTLIKTEVEAAGGDAGRTGVVTGSLTRDFEDGRDDTSGADDDNTRGDDDDSTRGDDDDRGGSDDRDDDTGGDDSTGGDDDNSGSDDD